MEKYKNKNVSLNNFMKEKHEISRYMILLVALLGSFAGAILMFLFVLLAMV